MAGLQRLTHHRGVARAVEGVVRPAARHLDQMRHHVGDGLRIDEMGHAEATAPVFLGVIDVHADDHVGPDHLQPLDDVQPDAAQAEDHAIGTRLHLRRIDHRPHPRGHATADVAGTGKRRVLANLRQGDLGQDGEIREGGTAHIVGDRLALVAEARTAVGHQPLALGGPDGGAQIGLAAQAAFALPTLGRVQRDHMVPDGHRGHPRPDLDHHPRALMAEDARKNPLRVQTVQRIGVGVADAGGLDLDQHLPGPRPLQIDLDNLQRTFGLKGDGGAGFHGRGSLVWGRLSNRSAPRQPPLEQRRSAAASSSAMASANSGRIGP